MIHIPAKADLERRKTLCVGQCCNLKLERRRWRVWVCRCGEADGVTGDGVSVEWFTERGRWEVLRDGHTQRSVHP